MIGGKADGMPDPESGPPGTIGGSVVGKPDPPLVPGAAGGTGNEFGGTGIDVTEPLPLDPGLLIVDLPGGLVGGVIGLGGVKGVAPGTV